jgi:hypothetical protein
LTYLISQSTLEPANLKKKRIDTLIKNLKKPSQENILNLTFEEFGTDQTKSFFEKLSQNSFF